MTMLPPESGESPWGDRLNAILLSVQDAFVDADREGDRIVVRRANGESTDLGDFRGGQGEQGEQGPPGADGMPQMQAVALWLSTSTVVRDALRTQLRRSGVVISALDAEYGVVADGIADDTAGLQAALDAAAGGELVVPSGTYRITQELRIPSGTTVTGRAGTVLSASGLATFISMRGQVGPEVPLATAATVGGRTITTTTPHGLAAGDVVRLTSQRIATSVDAGDWRLGVGTVNSTGPYFGEFGTVQKVTDATTVVLDTGLVFPDYLPNSAQETEANARPSATIAKVSGMRHSLLRGVELAGTGSGATANAIVLQDAVDCTVEEVRYSKPDQGTFIKLSGCYRSEAYRCWVSNDLAVPDDVSLFAINSYKVSGSQSSGFDRCTVLSGTQGFDITYEPSDNTQSRVPSVFCYVRNSRSHSALRGPLTVHPGTYGIVVALNDFDCATGGVTIRGNRSLVLGNIIRGSGVGYGLYFSEGGGKDSLAMQNHVANFETGLAIIDGAGKNYEGRIGIVFDANTVLDCLVGYTRVSALGRSLPTTPEAIAVTRNHFASRLTNAVAVSMAAGNRITWGTLVQGNMVRLTGAGSVAFLAGSNARDTFILNNTIMEAARTISRDGSSSSHAWPVPTVVDYSGNRSAMVGSTTLPLNDANYRMRSSDRDVQVVTGAIDLEHYREDIVVRAAALSQASIANHWPTDSFNGWAEVIKRSPTALLQRAWSSTGELYTRASNSSGVFPNTWTKRL